MDRWKALYEALIGDSVKLAAPRAIAQHVAKIQLLDLRGEDSLHPDLQERFRKLRVQMDALSMPISLAESFRTGKRQNELYAQGRTSPGSIVTQAKALQSYHNYGLAFDVIFQKDGYNAPSNMWITLGKEGKRLGLVWGGDWAEFPDRAHFEWHPGFTWKELEMYFKGSTA